MVHLLSSKELSKVSGGIIYHLKPDPNDPKLKKNMDNQTREIKFDIFTAPEVVKFHIEEEFYVAEDIEPHNGVKKCKTLEEAITFAEINGYSTVVKTIYKKL